MPIKTGNFVWGLKVRFSGSIVIVFFLICSGVGWCDAAAKAEPTAVQGVLDLQGWELEEDGTVPLNGEWAFYWKELIRPEAFKSDHPPQADAFVDVPGYWNYYELDALETGSRGFATYRLQIRNLTPGQTVVFKFATINTAFTLFANGETLFQCGTVGRTQSTSTPLTCPEKPVYHVTDDTLDLVVQISNFHHHKGGFWHGMQIGSYSRIAPESMIQLAIDIFLIGSILIIGLYHLGLFQLRPRDRSTLFFAICCLTISLRTALHNATFLYVVIPDFPWQAYLRLDYATLYIPTVTFPLFLRSLYPGEFHILGIKLILLLSAVFAVITLVTETVFFSGILYLYQMVIILTCVYIIWNIVRVNLHGREGALILLTGSLILVVSVFNDIFYSQSLVNTAFASSIGLFAFIFSQSYVISKRFTTALDTAEELSTLLEQKVTEQTAAIRDLLDNTGQGIFSIDQSLTVQQYASRETGEIFGGDISGQNAAELMFGDQETDVKGFIDVVFESGGRVSLVRDLLPSELKRNDRIFEISYRWIPPGAAGDGNIMIILDDVTAERHLEKLLDKDRIRDQKLIRIGSDRYGFVRLYNGILEEMTSIAEMLQREPHSVSANELSGIFHTIKGSTAAYGFQATSDIAHHLESRLEAAATEGVLNETAAEEIRQQLDELRAAFDSELEEVGDLVPKQFLQAAKTCYYTVPEDKIRQVEALLVDRLNEDETLRATFSELRKQPLRNLVRKMTSDAEAVAFQKSKQIAVKSSGEETEIFQPPFEALFASLIHLVRNAVDHGIETPDQRKQLGKPEAGILSLNFQVVDSQLEMTFSDDGRGIEAAVVKEKALESGLISETQMKEMPDREAMRLIFKPGFSTQAATTRISGRGIGLYAVQDAVEKLGGRVDVSSTPGQGTTFSFTIPMPILSGMNLNGLRQGKMKQ